MRFQKKMICYVLGQLSLEGPRYRLSHSDKERTQKDNRSFGTCGEAYSFLYKYLFISVTCSLRGKSRAAMARTASIHCCYDCTENVHRTTCK